jgi:hypothetical protein
MINIFNPTILTIIMALAPFTLTPQIIKALKSTEGLSLASFVLNFIIQVYFTLYYYQVNLIPSVINGIILSLHFLAIILIIIFKK